MLVPHIPLKAAPTPPPQPYELDQHTGPRAPGSFPPSPVPPPGGQSTQPRAPVTDGGQGSAGVSGGQEGARLGSSRGAGVFGIVVTWPVCLSVCVQVDEEHVAPLPPPPTTSCLSQGFDCRSRGLAGGIPWSSWSNPGESSCLVLLSTPMHLLWKCAALSRGGGNVQSKH